MDNALDRDGPSGADLCYVCSDVDKEVFMVERIFLAVAELAAGAISPGGVIWLCWGVCCGCKDDP